MTQVRVILFSLFCVTQAFASPIFPGCETKSYPPDKSMVVPKYIINLDLPPKERWRSLISEKKNQMAAIIDEVKNLTVTLLGEKTFSIINNSLPKLAATLPAPYYDEFIGISESSGLLLSEVTLYNIFYEIFTFCTSMIVQDPQGKIYHGRNLDFGLFMGWDSKNHTWRVAELLRPLVIHLEWQQKGQTIYESINYAGYVGILTAVKKDHFTFSLDERFGLNGGYVGLLEWILFHDHKQKWVAFLTREVMETANSYEEAEKQLSNPRLLAPVYFILGGTKPGQGVIITRYRDTYNSFPLGSKSKGQASWFLVETNYDHWKQPPFYDDRRTPAVQCLQEKGQESLSNRNASLSLIYNVLSTRPVLNKLTTYTALMDVSGGYIEAWLRSCPDPCWPW
ncbi:unnamed protein product [Meganyctiphanes norvegica]|uniref:Acid ceramidase n=1 Tax=Meganyctiphanes norvegica TaxID=48144 RepID=A0AAV2PZD6_MEGNR